MTVPGAFLLFALLDAQSYLLGKVESSGHGTGTLPTDALLSLQLVLPPDEALHRLARPFDALNERIGLARQEARALINLRDTLLPKLISGELRVKDAEKMVERSA